MLEKWGICIASGLLGICGGMTLSTTLGPESVEKAELFKEQERPVLIKTYNENERHNQILIDHDNDGVYITLSKYLNSIEDQAERELERARIKKAVNWYK